MCAPGCTGPGELNFGNSNGNSNQDQQKENHDSHHDTESRSLLRGSGIGIASLRLQPQRGFPFIMSMTDHITGRAKLDIIAATQAEDNERQRVEVSRSFVCMCTNPPEPRHTYSRT